MGMITMVASAKDGVGKSTTCINLADALTRKGKTVLVIELDNGLRSLDVFAGVYGMTVYDIVDVLNGRCLPEQAIAKAPAEHGELYVLSAPYRNDYLLQGDQFVQLCLALSSQFDHILIDTACMNEALVSASTVAMNAIMVATADPVGVRDARIIADRMRDMQVPNMRLLISRLDSGRVLKGIVSDLDYCIDAVGLQLIGVVPEDAEIALTNAAGKPLKTGRCKTVYDNIAERLLGEDTPLTVQ